MAWKFYYLKRDLQELINRYNDPDYADIIVVHKDELRQLQYELNDTDDNFPD